MLNFDKSISIIFCNPLNIFWQLLICFPNLIITSFKFLSKLQVFFPLQEGLVLSFTIISEGDK